ncbi:MAG: aldo/keto reductase [Ornithinimicrobium sp.]|uniref:aldo/keto reductase n=1 Tax=Ornithinimicrobium sp. TaxID=1977084 RepID=UPI003D9BED81
MTYRPLGDSGLMVSTVGIGCNAFGARVDQDVVTSIVDAALGVGVSLFDTADIYGAGASELTLGRALHGRRDEVVLATKFGMDMQGANGPDWGARGSRRYIRAAVEASLRRLDTDWIDLYQMHRPCPVTPVEETLAALQELVTEGKVRYLGSSNFAGWQVIEADWVARTGGSAAFISAQNKYSLLDRAAEAELIPACEHVGVGILPFFPLEYGLLTGKYTRDHQAPEGSRLSGDAQAERLAQADWDAIEAVQEYADQRGRSMLDVAIAGLAAQPAVASVISGVTSAEQVRSNAAALDWEPTLEDLAALESLPLR